MEFDDCGDFIGFKGKFLIMYLCIQKIMVWVVLCVIYVEQYMVIIILMIIYCYYLFFIIYFFMFKDSF